jgi:hypothetical protein
MSSVDAQEHVPATSGLKPPALKPEKPVNFRRDAQVLVIVIGAFLAMIVAGAVFASRSNEEDSFSSNEPRHTKHFSYAGDIVTDEPVTYAEVPPVGGPHANEWQNCGFYAGAVPSERAVHSMAHGAVWITYSPDLPQDEIDKLKAIAAKNDYVLVSMFEGLPNPIVASAWNHQLDFKVAGDPDLLMFVAVLQHGHGLPEPDGPCTGGSSELAS